MAMTTVPQKALFIKVMVALILRSKFVLFYALKVRFSTKQKLGERTSYVHSHFYSQQTFLVAEA